MSPLDFDITTLTVLDPIEWRACLLDYLTRPHYAPWGNLSAASFESAYRSVATHLSGDTELSHLLSLYLLSHLLSETASCPNWSAGFIKKHIDLAPLLPGISWDQLLSGAWASVPVPLVGAEGEAIRYVMTGALPGFAGHSLYPDWVRGIMDETSRSALHSAALAAKTTGHFPPALSLFCFPLAVANGRCQIKGASLGLPVALGFMRVLTGETVSDRYLATGAISPAGRVEKVECLPQKRTLALKSDRISLFLYPNESPPVWGDDGDLETVAVADLQEAWMAIRRYRPGNATDLTLFSEMLKNPVAFVDAMDRIDPAWVRHAAKTGACQKVIGEIAARPNLFAGLVQCLSRKLDRWDLDGTAVYLDLFPETLLETISPSAPLALFRFYTTGLALANHRGDVAGAGRWSCLAEPLLPLALKAEVNRCVDFFNHRFVSRHNLYDFSPALPNQLPALLSFLEHRHRDQCDFGCTIEPVLGRLYGTIAQNFAFCGPNYLSRSEACAQKAMAAFGDGKMPEYREDALRQYSYLTYAFLDAGDYRKAETALLQCLTASDWQEVWASCDAGQLTTFHHAAIARFLADTGDLEKCREYLSRCSNGVVRVNAKDHPVQLWYFNLGRMAGRLNLSDSAEAYFVRSLGLCAAQQSQPTLFIMALLPLSGLWRVGVLDKKMHAGIIHDVMGVAQGLNRSHFCDMPGLATEELMKTVWEAPHRWFPFSYR